MDSVPSDPRPVAPADASERAPAQVLAEAPPSGVLARVQKLLPLVHGLVRRTKALAAVSALSAVALWALLFEPWQWNVDPPTGGYAFPVLALLLLFVPAAAALLGALTLNDLLSLPAQIKGAMADTAGQARGALAKGGEGGRLFRLARALWAARALALDAKGGWLKAVAAARLVRLASLPFALALVGAVALNGFVIAAAVVAVLVAVVF